MKTRPNDHGASDIIMGLSDMLNSWLKKDRFDNPEYQRAEIAAEYRAREPECCVCDSETDRDHSELIPGFGEVCLDCLAEVATELRDNHLDVFQETIKTIRKRMGTDNDILLN